MWPAAAKAAHVVGSVRAWTRPLRGSRESCPGFGLENGHDVRSHDVGFVLRTFFRREGALVALLRQLVDMGLGLVVGTQVGQLTGRPPGEATTYRVQETIQDASDSGLFVHVFRIPPRGEASIIPVFSA